MRIPYVVKGILRYVYDTPDFMKQSSLESKRKVKADEFEWDEPKHETCITASSLTYLAATALAGIFHKIDPLHRILQKDVDVLMDLYPPDIILPLSVPLIVDEHYWMRCYRSRFHYRTLHPAVLYWKRTYLSAYLREYLETANPEVMLMDEAEALAELVAPHIYDLLVSELLMVRQPLPPVPSTIIEDCCVPSVPLVFDHIRIGPILRHLNNLRELAFVFGIKNLEDKYKTRYFEISKEDCHSICMGIKDLQHLKIFRINRSNLTCIKLKILMQTLISKDSIIELDFNHCHIGDYGLQVVGGFLRNHNFLRTLRIANNRFGEDGVQGIAYALQMKPPGPIEFIDLSLNQMSLKCATMLAAAMVRSKTKPQTLRINSCGFYGDSAEKIAGILSLNRSLTRLDMWANDFSGEAEATLIEAVEKNRNILNIDLRRTNISQETLETINSLLERNKALVGVKRQPSEEIPPLYLNEPEYLIWEYNPRNPDYVPGRYPEIVAEV